jgi:hypothetical protein
MSTLGTPSKTIITGVLFYIFSLHYLYFISTLYVLCETEGWRVLYFLYVAQLHGVEGAGQRLDEGGVPGIHFRRNCACADFLIRSVITLANDGV